MRKIQKFLMLLLFVCLSVSIIPATKSNAEETQGEQASASSGLKDENPYRLEEVTGMTADGDIVPEEVVEGQTDELPKMRAFSRNSSEKVVMFWDQDKVDKGQVTYYKEVGTGADGYTFAGCGGDAAYLGERNGKVRFMLSGVVGEVAASDVRIVNRSDIAVVSCYVVDGGRLIHNVAHNVTTPGWAAKLDNGAAPSYLKSGVVYYSYDGHYFYTNYATMLADYQKNSRSNSVNPSNPYYNYYQYLPLRSKTSYSGAQLNSQMNSKVDSTSKMYKTGDDFVNNQNTYGVNALLMTSVAANESGWGKSNISQNKNNLFGLNAVDSSPGTSANTYASVQECIKQFANGWMSRGYLYPADSRYRGGFLGNKASGLNVKYASDPYWGERAANIAYSMDNRGGSKDYNKYTIGVKDTISTSHTPVNVRNGSSESATKLYGTGIASNYAVLIQNKTPENGFYRIQSDAVLDANRTAIVKDKGEYSYDNMYAYISANYVRPVNQGNDTVVVKKTLQSIAITEPASKLEYTAGEKFNPAGMVVTAKWSDGTQSDVTANVTYPITALTAGTTSVTISYVNEGVTKSVTQAITVKEPAVVTEVAISPVKAEMKAGESQIFGVRIVGTGNPSKEVTWSVEGASSTETKISETGKLQIAADETAETLIVKVVSVADSTKSAQAQITVVKNVEPEPELPDGEKPDTEEPDSEMKPETEVKNEDTGISVKGKLPEGTELKVETLDKASENYDTYIEPVETNTILGVYDISLSEKLSEGQSVTLEFPVAEEYNDKEAVVLHYNYVDENSEPFIETYDSKVSDGKVTIEVTGFSPYVVALNDPKEPEVPVVPPEDEPGDNNDTSGDVTPTVPPAQIPLSSNTVTTPPANTTTTTSPITPSSTDTKKDDKTPTEQTKNKSADDKTLNSGGDKVKTDAVKAAKTGDASALGIWFVLCTMAAMGIVVVVMQKRKVN